MLVEDVRQPAPQNVVACGGIVSIKSSRWSIEDPDIWGLWIYLDSGYRVHITRGEVEFVYDQMVTLKGGG